MDEEAIGRPGRVWVSSVLGHDPQEQRPDALVHGDVDTSPPLDEP